MIYLCSKIIKTMANIKTNSIKAWLLAFRPKTLTGAATPVMLGCALAIQSNNFIFPAALLCFIFAFLMQIDANLINDLFDFVKGSDRADRLGPKRACAQGWITIYAMKRGIAFITMCAALTGVLLLFYGGLEMIPIGILCLIFAFLYTAGPYPLAYNGWGDILVIIFFGFIPVGCTYYVMCHDWNMNVTITSLACGLIIDTLLIVNNYRDIEQDSLSGKKTIIVKFGKEVGEKLYLYTGIIAIILCSIIAFEGYIWAFILPSLYIIPHYFTWKKMKRISKGKELNLILGETSRNIILFGILLSVGLML